MTRIILRIPESLYHQIRADLIRPHEFAGERAGFCFARSKVLFKEEIIICLNDYKTIADEDYIDNPEVGAQFGERPINEAIGHGFEHRKSVFHVHMHEFSSSDPQFSWTDLEGLPPIAESCSRIIQDEVHGLLLLSRSNLNALVWLPNESTPVLVDQITVGGSPMNVSFPLNPLHRLQLERYNRQSFLGEYSEALFARLRIGVVGLGGGGSHVVQQLAHIGIRNFVLFDDDRIDESNLNRLVGATLRDKEDGTLKFDIAKRVISNLHMDFDVKGGAIKWEESPEHLQSCDIVVGCVDSLDARRSLEAECRRYLIPYVDIGMGIDRPVQKAPYIYGQVHLSLPENACLICKNLLNPDDLKKEAEKYGEIGGRPQVVWPNGALASTAVGVVVDLITGWTSNSDRNLHLTYDGNEFEMGKSIFADSYSGFCPHYPVGQSGPLNM